MTGHRLAPPGYITADEAAAWLGRTGGWIRLLRHNKLPSYAPLPEPDMFTTRQRRPGERIALWRRERLSEFEDWFRAHLRQGAEAQIQVMEEHVARMRQQEAS